MTIIKILKKSVTRIH